MAIASTSFTGVDLSRLPVPDVIEELDYEAVLAQLLGKYHADNPELDALVESDPAYKIAEIFAYYELLVRQRVNEAARAVLAAYATGSDLDALGALFSVERYILDPGDPANGIEPTLESDDDFRRRIVLAPQSYSVAGPEGAYLFHALSADGAVKDASVDSPDPADIRALVLSVLADNGAAPALVDAVAAALDAAIWPGSVFVSVLSRNGDGSPTPELLDTVLAKLDAKSVRPLTDKVIVRPAEILSFAIDAELSFFDGPDRTVVMNAARDQLAEYLNEALMLGRKISCAAIIAKLFVSGIADVKLNSPPADIVPTIGQAGYCTGINLTATGA